MRRQYCRGPLLCAGSLQHPGCVEAAATCTPLARTLHPWQAELGMRSSDMVSVKFVDEISVVGMLLQLAPTLLLIGATYWCALGAGAGEGGGGGEGHGSAGAAARQRGRRGREGGGLGLWHSRAEGNGGKQQLGGPQRGCGQTQPYWRNAQFAGFGC